ncbi:hypothetical protein CORC01_12908 [Colletotrichum orchidophilum]|uniref:Uncharacterized protein n=1 Tax=Colletotrichum orchidophilum TaxID=1209926 RepID=A0A1G4ARQ0_9PEZI|nr:uncharacterized protein CORC01_12908 [Colletotrichum orchidophilum]OHE91781.1 hypothetical protein CORC01_12908 [Colletotrichum orchidophilum]
MEGSLLGLVNWDHGTCTSQSHVPPDRMPSNEKRKWGHGGHTRAAETCSSTVATIMRWPRLKWTQPGPGNRFAIAAAIRRKVKARLLPKRDGGPATGAEAIPQRRPRWRWKVLW